HFFFQAEDGIRHFHVTGVQTCALPISLIVKRPAGTFLDAQYPRPVSGCAAEVSQRIAEAVFSALVQAIPARVTAAPAGTSGNFRSEERRVGKARGSGSGWSL